MEVHEPFGLTHDKVGGLPIVNWFMQRMGVAEVLVKVIRQFDIGLSQLHNDSTTVAFPSGQRHLRASDWHHSTRVPRPHADPRPP